MDQQGIVIVGAGAAGISAAVTVRAGGFEGPLVLINGEPHQPYNRTLVNKGLLPGLLTAEQIAQPGLDTLDGGPVQTRAASVDTENSVLRLEDGRSVPYAALIAASGSAPRPDGRVTAAPGLVFHLHTPHDAVRLREQLGENVDRKTVTILGAGFVGAETASYLAEAGTGVHLIFQPVTPLLPALGKQIAQRIAELHRRNVHKHFGQDVTNLTTGAASVSVTLSDGQTLESDLAVIAHGTAPSTAWLTGEDNGLAVDSRLRARGYRRVYAAGSVAIHPASGGQLYRIGHWDAAAAQGAHAARTVLHDLTGAPDPGPYSHEGGFTLTVYRQSAAVYGTVLPGSEERQHDTGAPGTALTSFHRADGAITAVAGLDAFPQLLAARSRLTSP